MRPLDHSEDEGDAEIDQNRAPGSRQPRRQRHPQWQMREGLDDLDAALDQHVDPAAVIPGDTADYDAEGEADGHADQTDSQRDPRAINDARQHIAAKAVGSEQKQLAALSRANQVEIVRDEAPM